MAGQGVQKLRLPHDCNVRVVAGDFTYTLRGSSEVVSSGMNVWHNMAVTSTCSMLDDGFYGVLWDIEVGKPLMIYWDLPNGETFVSAPVGSIEIIGN